MRSPIDPDLFASGQNLEGFECEADIRADAHAVYRAFSDGEAFRRAYAPDREELRADIDLAIGGRYEWLWDGETGSNGCQILSYLPDRMICFSWNAPPTQPESRRRRTWVVVEFQAREPGSTHLRLTHWGFGREPHWQETKEYFQKAWPHVLEQFRQHLET